jgi:predicted Fe-Mo cluster-binding NifX family protein
MGAGAIEIFNEKGIVVVTGATGDAETAAADYLNGRLVSSDTVCQKHEHHGDCGHH